MTELLREAPLGQVIRWVTGNRVLQYPEELPGFELPATYNALLNSSEKTETRPDIAGHRQQSHASALTRQSSISDDPSDENERSDLEKVDTEKLPERDPSLHLARTKSRLETTPYTEERLELEAELAIERTQTKPIVPIKTADGVILVDWYTTDDSKLLPLPPKPL